MYIAAPFRRFSSEMKGRTYGEITNRDYIALLERVEKVLLEAGYDTYLPHRDKGKWGKIYIQPKEIAKMCFDLISLSDVVVALPGQGRGVHIELGFATALKKELIIILREKEVESIFIPGLGEQMGTTIIRFKDEKDLIQQLKRAINARKKREA